MSSNTRVSVARRIEQSHIADELRKQMEAYRRATSERQRRNIVNGVVILRLRRNRPEYDYDDVSTVQDEYVDDEEFPPHGKRGTYSAVYSDPQFGALAAEHAAPNPDGSRPTADEYTDGWRTVTKRFRRKHVMTNSELERAAGVSQDENSEEGDHNGDLNERNQRREFY